MSHTSTLRVLVDKALDEKNTTFEDFIANHSEGPLYEAHAALVEETGIPIQLRTFYRWAENLEVSA